MMGLPIPKSPIVIATLQLILTLAVMVINRIFFINGFKSALKGAPNMDTLVAMGSGTAFVYSLWVTFSILFAQIKGDVSTATHLLHGLYYESAAMILTLITVGKMLEAYSKGKTTDALKSLANLASKFFICPAVRMLFALIHP